MTKKKSNQPEILYFDPEYLKLFMQAVKNASARTSISNDSIIQKDECSVEIYSTRAYFLLEVGEQYQILVQKKDGAPQST